MLTFSTRDFLSGHFFCAPNCQQDFTKLRKSLRRICFCFDGLLQNGQDSLQDILLTVERVCSYMKHFLAV